LIFLQVFLLVLGGLLDDSFLFFFKVLHSIVKLLGVLEQLLFSFGFYISFLPHQIYFIDELVLLKLHFLQ